MRSFGVPLVCVLVLLGAAGANADGGPRPQVYSLPGYEPHDWSGFYGGVQGGWLEGRYDFREFEPGLRFPRAVALTETSGGFAVGGVLGFNEQDESWVYGGEIDVQFTDLSAGVITPAGNRLTKELNFRGSVRGRLGYSLDRVLPYLTAGLALGNLTLEASDGARAPNRLSNTQTSFGYTAGAGVEIALGESWSAGVEYRYTRLGETVAEGDFIDSNFRFPGSNRFHAVQARLLWRFGK